jgi:CBS-domain-containing membrane protein
MALFRVSHPPAGATTLIVSLGIISQPKELVIIEVAVILLTAQAFAINRLAGVPYPLWRNRDPAETIDIAARATPGPEE